MLPAVDPFEELFTEAGQRPRKVEHVAASDSRRLHERRQRYAVLQQVANKNDTFAEENIAEQMRKHPMGYEVQIALGIAPAVRIGPLSVRQITNNALDMCQFQSRLLALLQNKLLKLRSQRKALTRLLSNSSSSCFVTAVFLRYGTSDASCRIIDFCRVPLDFCR